MVVVNNDIMDIEESLASRFESYRGTNFPMPSPVESSPRGGGDDGPTQPAMRKSGAVSSMVKYLKESKYFIIIAALVIAYMAYKRYYVQQDISHSQDGTSPDLSPPIENEDPLFVPIGEL